MLFFGSFNQLFLLMNYLNVSPLAYEVFLDFSSLYDEVKLHFKPASSEE